MTVTGVGVLAAFMFLSVFFPHDISKSDAAMITRLDTDMFLDKS